MKLKLVLALVLLLLLAPLALVHTVLRASLPRLDGDFQQMGVIAPVTISRDEQGVPTISAANRVDLAYGTGFVHGQDRFFQMDLSRRLAAGELSELLGTLTLEQDKKARPFRFRSVARQALQKAPADQRAILEAYARGVNAGLGSLRSRPWEYWALGSPPRLWQPEDTILVSHSMWWDLQYSGFERELVRQRINRALGGPTCAGGWKCNLPFFYPAHTDWDAPNGAAAEAVAAAATRPVVPPPEVLDVRRGTTGVGGGFYGRPPAPEAAIGRVIDRGIGSNNWAVAGRLTATGAALVANDMHLYTRVPMVWYRARLRVAPHRTQAALDVTGVTLPGAPVVVAGSNGHVAWGFTNSYGEWQHLEPVACAAGAAGGIEIDSVTGSPELHVEHEQIRVHGRPSVGLEVITAAAGVLLAASPEQHVCWFASWLAQRPEATNLNLLALESATSVAGALAVAPTLGIPHQNFVVGDSAGHIAWSIAGRIPADNGPARAQANAAWLRQQLQPRIVDPDIGRVWTANARPTDDPAQEQVIGGEAATVGAFYDLGARARQIRDDLLAIKTPATPADMLRIQLDDRALFLARWRELLLGLLDAQSLQQQPLRAEFRQLVAAWNARASVDSSGYRLVRAFHDRTQEAVWSMLLPALGYQAAEHPDAPTQFEPALWELVNSQPQHLLAAAYPSWRALLLAQLDATLAELRPVCPHLSACTWGAHKPVRIRHPLSAGIPWLERLLDMPTVELPGDHEMPRVQDGPAGASERFAVSPGHEEQGYIQLPGGQSGHPLSPYYRAGFTSWVEGTPTAFLPGATRHELTLQPP